MEPTNESASKDIPAQQQSFILAGNNPLEVETFRYGEDNRVTVLANEKEEKYITTVLEEAA